MKIYKTLFLGLGLIALSSCSDFLNQTSPSELDNESTFNNAYYTELALNKVYGSLTQDQTYSNFLPIIAGTNTDCELIDGLGTDASNTSSERGNMNYNANPGWSQLSKVWDAMYGVIENANLVVDGINNSQLIQQAGATRTSMMRFRAEAMTLRAMIYFDLIRLFGDIPFKTESSNSDLSNVYIGKADLPIIAGTNTDCELIDGLGTDASNTSSERGNMNYNANPGWSQLSKVWDAMYGVIENANLVVDGINNSQLIQQAGATRTSMMRFRAEAMTLRAMIYFDLIRLFGDIPFKTESSNSDLSNVYIGKADRDDIMDELIIELEEAIGYLPWAGEDGYTTEHVSKGYAHALLANIAMTRAGYAIREQAKEGYITGNNSDATYPTQRCSDAKRRELFELAEKHLAAVVSSGKHKLNPSVEEYWRLINIGQLDQTYQENLFEIPMGLNKSGELGYTIGYRINGASSLFGPKGNSSGKLKLTAPYYLSFGEGDIRRDLTCAISQLSTDKNTKVFKEYMLGNAPFGLYCGKWDYRKMMENSEWYAAVLASDQKVCSGINVVKMRYPQVLLMYAEVVNELYGKGATAEGCTLTATAALKEVHDRAFTDATKRDAAWTALMGKDFFDAIVDENAWELAGEGVRKFDLIRWNLLSEKIDEFKNEYTNAVYNGTYPQYVNYKYRTDNPMYIDMTSLVFGAKVGGEYENKSFFGAETSDKEQKNLKVNLPSISGGLNKAVKNRYLLPIASTTISTSNGKLHNSYGYSD